MTSAGPTVASPDPTVYPVEERVGEDIIQRLIVELLRPLVERWLAHRGEPTFVGADQFIYFEQYNAHRRVAPDVYVLPGVPPETIVTSWKTWETDISPSFACEVVSQNWEKDYYDVPPMYAALGARELIVFDPNYTERRDGVRWQRFGRRDDGRWQRLEHSNADRIRSEVLGCWLRAVGVGPRVRLRLAHDPNGDALFPTAEEAERSAKEVAQARIAELEAELERRR